MKNFYIIDHPLIKKNMTILREKNTNHDNFRAALKRITSIMAYEINKDLKLRDFEIETPLEKTIGYELSQDIVLVAILRAGLGMVNSFLEFIPEAKVGHIGLQRNEVTLEPVDYYYKIPKILNTAKVILLDPMLATGGSGAAALDYLKANGAHNCTFACLVAAPQGIEKINQTHPDVKIFAAALDRTLNEKGYILPGLGDAGDRIFGT